MNSLNEYAGLAVNRKNTYTLLSRLYKTEVDEGLYGLIASVDFDALSETELAEGYGLIKRFIDGSIDDPITDLAVDYARVFLGAGIIEKNMAANPYESVYTSRERLIMQEARDEVVAVYRRNGLDKIADLHIPEDHIAIEMEFMAALCERPVNEKNLLEQKEFLTKHLLNWVPTFCEDLEKFAQTDFYRGLALITVKYLQIDLDMIEEMLA